jgi:sensor domain CHASE-containing protein
MNGSITAWQLWAAVAMPTFATLLGILLNRRDVDRLDRRIESVEVRLDKRLDSVDSRLNQQTQVFHQDVLSLLKMHQELDTRLTRMEQR